MRQMTFAAGAAVVLVPTGLATGADAQSPPKRVRGTIAGVSADPVTVHTADGTDHTLKLAPDARIASDRALTLADIKPGDYIGTAAAKQADGRLIAIEFTVFLKIFAALARASAPGTKALTAA